jgi:hypothetical protein
MTLNDVVDVMLDVSALATRGSDLARTEARRVAAERERRADEQARRLADQAALLPVSIVAVGGVEPVERLMTLQSAIARAVHLATCLGRLRLRLPRGRFVRHASTITDSSGRRRAPSFACLRNWNRRSLGTGGGHR